MDQLIALAGMRSARHQADPVAYEILLAERMGQSREVAALARGRADGAVLDSARHERNLSLSHKGADRRLDASLEA
jgi:hypothetical protein